MFEITLNKGQKPVVKTTYHLVEESTEHRIFFFLEDGFGGTDAMITYMVDYGFEIISGRADKVKILINMIIDKYE